MKIQDYTFGQYLELKKEEQLTYNTYINYARNLEKKNYIDSTPIEEMQFVQVKDMMQAIVDVDTFIAYVMTNIKQYSEGSIHKMSAWKVIFSFQVLIEQIAKLIEVENNTLVGIVTSETKQASEMVDFSEFSYYPQLLELANGDITKIEQVGKMKYYDCYIYLRYNTKKQMFEKRLQEIYERKNKI